MNTFEEIRLVLPATTDGLADSFRFLRYACVNKALAPLVVDHVFDNGDVVFVLTVTPHVAKMWPAILELLFPMSGRTGKRYYGGHEDKDGTRNAYLTAAYWLLYSDPVLKTKEARAG
jgi:hypothetical protein